MPHDPYEQYADLSTTPFWDAIIGLFTVATIVGGGLGAVYAIGYFVTGHADAAWPLTGTFLTMVAINVLLRRGRAIARRRR